jgi:hypothetical protein
VSSANSEESDDSDGEADTWPPFAVLGEAGRRYLCYCRSDDASLSRLEHFEKESYLSFITFNQNSTHHSSIVL